MRASEVSLRFQQKSSFEADELVWTQRLETDQHIVETVARTSWQQLPA